MSRLISLSLFRFRLVCFFGFVLSSPLFAQDDAPPVRVNVTLNNDGSRTVYQFDQANHKATATTTEADGRTPRGKIEYTVDDVGRFSAGMVYGPDGKFRFKTLYKYDAPGHVIEESQLAQNGRVVSKIVYSYDRNGKQSGYSVFDGNGKLLGQTSNITSTVPQQGGRQQKPGKR